MIYSDRENSTTRCLAHVFSQYHFIPMALLKQQIVEPLLAPDKIEHVNAQTFVDPWFLRCLALSKLWFAGLGNAKYIPRCKSGETSLLILGFTMDTCGLYPAIFCQVIPRNSLPSAASTNSLKPQEKIYGFAQDPTCG